MNFTFQSYHLAQFHHSEPSPLPFRGVERQQNRVSPASNPQSLHISRPLFLGPGQYTSTVIRSSEQTSQLPHPQSRSHAPERAPA